MTSRIMTSTMTLALMLTILALSQSAVITTPASPGSGGNWADGMNPLNAGLSSSLMVSAGSNNPMGSMQTVQNTPSGDPLQNYMMQNAPSGDPMLNFMQQNAPIPTGSNNPIGNMQPMQNTPSGGPMQNFLQQNAPIPTGSNNPIGNMQPMQNVPSGDPVMNFIMQNAPNSYPMQNFTGQNAPNSYPMQNFTGQNAPNSYPVQNLMTQGAPSSNPMESLMMQGLPSSDPLMQLMTGSGLTNSPNISASQTRTLGIPGSYGNPYWPSLTNVTNTSAHLSSTNGSMASDLGPLVNSLAFGGFGSPQSPPKSLGPPPGPGLLDSVMRGTGGTGQPSFGGPTKRTSRRPSSPKNSLMEMLTMLIMLQLIGGGEMFAA